jgi:hypothetical protein
MKTLFFPPMHRSAQRPEMMPMLGEFSQRGSADCTAPGSALTGCLPAKQSSMNVCDAIYDAAVQRSRLQKSSRMKPAGRNFFSICCRVTTARGNASQSQWM